MIKKVTIILNKIMFFINKSDKYSKILTNILIKNISDSYQIIIKKSDNYYE